MQIPQALRLSKPFPMSKNTPLPRQSLGFSTVHFALPTPSSASRPHMSMSNRAHRECATPLGPAERRFFISENREQLPRLRHADNNRISDSRSCLRRKSICFCAFFSNASFAVPPWEFSRFFFKLQSTQVIAKHQKFARFHFFLSISHFQKAAVQNFTCLLAFSASIGRVFTPKFSPPPKSAPVRTKPRRSFNPLEYLPFSRPRPNQSRPFSAALFRPFFARRVSSSPLPHVWRFRIR